MTARRSRGLPRVRSRETRAPTPLPNVATSVVVTFTTTGVFEISFAAHQRQKGTHAQLRRIPTHVLAVLRRQLLLTHNELWAVTGLSVNPVIVNDQKVQINPRTVGAFPTREQRVRYVKLLQRKFTAACSQADVRGSMVLPKKVTSEPTKKTAAKASPAPSKTAASGAKASNPKKTTAKKAASKKAAKKRGATREPRRRMRR